MGCQHNVRDKTVKAHLHTFQNGGHLKTFVLNATKTSGIMLDVQLIENVIVGS